METAGNEAIKAIDSKVIPGDREHPVPDDQDTTMANKNSTERPNVVNVEKTRDYIADVNEGKRTHCESSDTTGSGMKVPVSIHNAHHTDSYAPDADVAADNTKAGASTACLDHLYGELDESDITEIYLGSSETESAVAGLEMSTTNDIIIEPLEEQISHPGNQAIQLDETNYEKQAFATHVYDMEHIPVSENSIKNEESSFAKYDRDSGYITNDLPKKRPASPAVVDEPRSKRVKEEVSEYTPILNTNGHNVTKPDTPLHTNNQHTVLGNTHNRGHGAMDSCPPVAIVSPLGLRDDLLNETVSIKREHNSGAEVDDMKSDINSILDSFDNHHDLKEKEFLDTVDDKSSSIKLTDLEFEKFKHDLFYEHSFKTLDGNNWSFRKHEHNHSATPDARIAVETEIGDFEKVLNSFIKRPVHERSERTNQQHANSTRTAKIPFRKPTPSRYQKQFDHTDPNVVLANSELLRELLDDNTPVTKGNKLPPKRSASVDLSFLNTDIIAAKGSALSSTSVLRTKTIEPSVNLKQSVKVENSRRSSFPGDNSGVQITVPDESKSNGSERKFEDHGPLSLAEQRMASVTLHHKVPSISDLMSATGPLNKMDGHETEALLNELIGSPVSGNFEPYRDDCIPTTSPIGLSDYNSIPLEKRQKIANTTMPVLCVNDSGFARSDFDIANSRESNVNMGNVPNMQPGPKGVADLSSVDFENLPPERRQILAARYGHLIRARRDMADQMKDPLTSPPTAQQQHTVDTIKRHSNGNVLVPEFHSVGVNKQPMFSNNHPGDINFINSQSNDPLNAIINNTAGGRNVTTPHSRDYPVGSSGTGSTDDRMRYLMMQQLHRRRRMLSRQANTQIHLGANPRQMPPQPPPGVNHKQHMPQIDTTLKARFPEQHAAYPVQRGQQQFMGYTARIENNPPQYPPEQHQRHVGQSPQAGGVPRMMHPHAKQPFYHRQLSSGGMSQPPVQVARQSSATPPHNNMLHVQHPSYQAQIDPSQRQFRHHHAMPQSSHPQPNHHLQRVSGHNPAAEQFNPAYMQGDAAYKRQYPNMTRNGLHGPHHGQPNLGVDTTSSAAAPTLQAPTFNNDQQSSDPFSSEFFL